MRSIYMSGSDVSMSRFVMLLTICRIAATCYCFRKKDLHLVFPFRRSIRANCNALQYKGSNLRRDSKAMWLNHHMTLSFVTLLSGGNHCTWNFVSKCVLGSPGRYEITSPFQYNFCIGKLIMGNFSYVSPYFIIWVLLKLYLRQKLGNDRIELYFKR